MSLSIAQANHSLMMQEIFQGQTMNSNKTNAAKDVDNNFGNMFMNQLNKTNELQRVADVETEKFVVGETENIHDVLIAMEEAKLAFEFTTQIRNKVIDAYSELKNMQV